MGHELGDVACDSGDTQIGEIVIRAPAAPMIQRDHAMSCCLERQNDAIPTPVIHAPAMNQDHGPP